MAGVLKSFDIENVPYLADLVQEMGIPPQYVPTLDVTLYGDAEKSDENGLVETINGEIAGSLFGGLVSFPSVF